MRCWVARGSVGGGGEREVTCTACRPVAGNNLGDSGLAALIDGVRLNANRFNKPYGTIRRLFLNDSELRDIRCVPGR